MRQCRRCLSLIFCAACLLSPFATASVADTAPQDKPSACAPRGGEELVNFGRQWNTWSDAERSIYLEGFVDGQSHTFLLFWNDVSSERRESLRRRSFTLYEPSAIRDVITSLYSDPANTYVTLDSMVYVARDKLAGKDIDENLRQARQENCAFIDVHR